LKVRTTRESALVARRAGTRPVRRARRRL